MMLVEIEKGRVDENRKEEEKKNNSDRRRCGEPGWGSRRGQIFRATLWFIYHGVGLLDDAGIERRESYYIFLFYKNHVYKNVEAQICLKFKNIVVILLVAISISFPASDEIQTFL